MKSILAAAALAALSTTTALAAEPAQGRLAPRNECTRTPGLAELDAALRTAVPKRDREALFALMDDEILLDFGGGSGKEELTQRLTSPDYRLWDALDEILKLGCGLATDVEGNQNAAWPWYFNKDLGQRDPFETLIVTGTNVRMRKGPSAFSSVVGSVSWDYVFISDYPEEGAKYAKVSTRSGKSGYMAVKYLRSEIDYRLVADKTSGKWLITAFVAGD